VFRLRSALAAFAALATLSLVPGCAVNPVTGRSELSLVSEAEERKIGTEQFVPSQQGQGGRYQVDPELTAYVRQVGKRLADVSDRKFDYEFVVLNNGVPNAWALPGGKIAVNRGLLYELNNEAELAAVLGHEVSHAAIGHGAQAMSRGTLMQGVMAIGKVAMAASDNNRYGDYVLGQAQLGAQLVTQHYGRDAEREADHYGIQYMVKAGYDPHAAISLQETFVVLFEDKKSDWMQGMFASHPPSAERVENNRAQVAALMPALAGRALELGEARFREATARLRKTRGAYKAFDDAEKLVGKQDYQQALTKLDAAIKQVPEEARFHGLKGDIEVNQKHYGEALASYNTALKYDSSYYDYYLGRGVAYARLNQTALARQDLEQSTKLLPTAMAMNELGKVAMTNGKRAEAKRYFLQAAQAKGLVGEEARAAFTRIDMEDNPAAYPNPGL
jgi:predicted Zn-dependent protease